MGLTKDEEDFVKDLYERHVEAREIKDLEDEMWVDVNELKDGNHPEKWKKIQDRKQKFREDKQEIEDE